MLDSIGFAYFCTHPRQMHLHHLRADLDESVAVWSESLYGLSLGISHYTRGMADCYADIRICQLFVGLSAASIPRWF